MKKPRCYGSNPSYQSQAENDCETCKEANVCLDMDNKINKGLLNRYNVTRTNGKEVGECIVLEFKDENARQGIWAFAQTCYRAGYKKLADDLLKKVQSYDKKEK